MTEGHGGGKAGIVMEARKQWAKGPAGEGDAPFQITPPVTHLFWPDLTTYQQANYNQHNPIQKPQLWVHEALGDILDINSNSAREITRKPACVHLPLEHLTWCLWRPQEHTYTGKMQLQFTAKEMHVSHHTSQPSSFLKKNRWP